MVRLSRAGGVQGHSFRFHTLIKAPLLIRAQTNANAQEAPQLSWLRPHKHGPAHMHMTAADCGFRCCDFPPAFPLALTDSPLCSDPAPDWERWGRGGGHLTELICSRNSTDALVNTLSRTHMHAGPCTCVNITVHPHMHLYISAASVLSVGIL